jgi:hypothetical protein
LVPILDKIRGSSFAYTIITILPIANKIPCNPPKGFINTPTFSITSFIPFKRPIKALSSNIS